MFSRPALKPTLSLATHALTETIHHLDPKEHSAARSMCIALVALCDSQKRVENDVELLHNKLQPILRSLSDDGDDWRTFSRDD